MTRTTHLNRRQLIVLGAAASAGVLGADGLRKVASAVARQVPRPTGTPYPLVALRGKAPLGQVYDHPPNYETPTPRLIGERNPPFTDNEDYYVRYREADIYRVDPADYQLHVGGEAASERLEFTLTDLKGMPSVTVGTVGACAGLGRGLVRPLVPGMPWTKGDVSCAEWTGAPMREVLRLVGAKPDASVVALRGGRTIAATTRDYWRHWDLEKMLEREPLLAYEMNGEPLPIWNGFPVRMVVPGTYAPAWVKQLVEIDVRRTPHPGEWSGRAPGVPVLKTMSLIIDPPDGTRVDAGSTVELRGVAWDGGQGIRKVELSTDDGRTWREADLDRARDRHVWRVFRAKVPVGGPGRQWVLSRATSVDGETQPMDIPDDVLKDSVRMNTAVRTFRALLEAR